MYIMLNSPQIYGNNQWVITLYVSVCLYSNPEYKDTPIDIAQLPNLPEKTSESSETSDSESESKENSGIIIVLSCVHMIYIYVIAVSTRNIFPSFSASYCTHLIQSSPNWVRAVFRWLQTKHMHLFLISVTVRL